jgi:hypothetical protein
MVTVPPYRRTNVPATPDAHCVACATYQRPRDVPCEQHAIGVRVRSHQLFDAVQLITFGVPGRMIVHRAA